MIRRPLSRVVAGSGALVAACLLALPAASPVAAAGPCVMTVTKHRTAHHRLASGVVVDRYAVTVSRRSRTQTATVERLLMPRHSGPHLLTQPLGTARTLAEQLAARGPSSMAAVNGDFFDWYSVGRRLEALPLGPSVTRRAIVRSSVQPRNVVGVDTDGHPYAGSLAVAGTVTQGTTSYPVTGVNWQTVDAPSVVVFTSRWADSADAPRPAGAVEWVVARGHLTEVRTADGRGLPVARGTRVVAFGSTAASTARDAVVGDRVSVAVAQATSDGSTLAEAIGRGRTLVDGAATVLSCTTTTLAERPRTTVGWTGRLRWGTLTVLGDGYDSHGYRYGGLGLAAEANVAAALGFSAAYELDGGGSTAAYVHRPNARWDRLDDADTAWARPIPNGLVFTTR